jgi:hypothetical protein
VTLGVVGIVVLGVLVLAAGVVWAVRDVARYRIDVDVRREQVRADRSTHERIDELVARMDRADVRVGKVESIAAGVAARPRRA